MSFFPWIPPSGSKLWVLHRDTWGAAVQQGEAAQQWWPMGVWDSGQHTGRLPVQINWSLRCVKRGNYTSSHPPMH